MPSFSVGRVFWSSCWVLRHLSQRLSLKQVEEEPPSPGRGGWWRGWLAQVHWKNDHCWEMMLVMVCCLSLGTVDWACCVSDCDVGCDVKLLQQQNCQAVPIGRWRQLINRRQLMTFQLRQLHRWQLRLTHVLLQIPNISSSQKQVVMLYCRFCLA